jgi:hypothetical protein
MDTANQPQAEAGAVVVLLGSEQVKAMGVCPMRAMGVLAHFHDPDGKPSAFVEVKTSGGWSGAWVRRGDMTRVGPFMVSLLSADHDATDRTDGFSSAGDRVVVAAVIA